MTEPASPLIMGVVNVTLDSFSDGGKWFDPDAAIRHGLQLAAQGADIVDVGGEATSPGKPRVDAEEELRRVLPVIAGLAERDVLVSVDTMRASVAREAVFAGASIINDVSAGLADPAMPEVAAASSARYVAMHWRGHADSMDGLAEYSDIVGEVRDELSLRIEVLIRAGMDPGRIILDPGLGFAKPGVQNWELLAHLDELSALGYPLLVGASRKRFVGALLPEEASVMERDLPSAVISAFAALAGVWAVRVHDVTSTRRAVAVARAWQSGLRGPGYTH